MSTSSISNHSSVENLYEGLLKTVSENEINFNAWKDSIVNMVNSMAKRECGFTTKEEFEEELKLLESMISSHTKEIWYSWPKPPKISMTAFFMLP